MSIVTVTRGSLSGGAELATTLGGLLGCRVVSREVIVEAAKTYGVSEEDLARGMEHPPSLWSRLTGSVQDYRLAVRATLAEMVEEGDVIYHGLAGPFLLEGLRGVLKIKLIAPMERRVEAAQRSRGLSAAQAVIYIREVDRARGRWIRRLYDADWSDPAHYDLVINLGVMSIDTAAATVVDVLSRSEYRTPEAARARRDFALEMRIRAHLRFRSTLPNVPVDVSVQEGVVRIGGGAEFEANREAIANYVATVQGVRNVQFRDGAGSGIIVAPHESSAREAMVPLSRYPHVYEWVTIRSAVAALSSSSVRLDDGHVIQPRYLLVLDRRRRLVGIVARHDLLRGMAPGYRSLRGALAKLDGVLPTHLERMQVNVGWSSLFGPAALEAAQEPVGSVMREVGGVVGADEPLSTVVSTMVHHGMDIVPVVEGPAVLGVVVMTDLFDLVAQNVMEARAAANP